MEGEKMLKGSLNDFVLNIEKKENLEFPIWVSVPGSFLSGTLVSNRSMVRQISELMMSAATITDQAFMSIGTDLIDELESEYIESASSVQSAHLLGVTIFHGDKIVHSPFAIVDLNTIGAWGIGQFNEEI